MLIYFIYLGLVTYEIYLIRNYRVEMKNNFVRKLDEKQIWAVIACLQLILLVGLRGYGVGADMDTYLGALEYYRSMPWNEVLSAKLVSPYDFEIGYFVLTKLCAFFQMNNTIFLFVIAIIIYVPVFIFIARFSDYPELSILIYFGMGLFTYSLGIFRQMIAISICLLGMNYIKERKLIKYVGIILLAMLFHTTAIVMLPLYFLYKLDMRIAVIGTIVAEVIGLLLGRPIIRLALVIFPKYAGFLGGKYDVIGGSYLMLILLNMLLLLGIVTYKYYHDDSFTFKLSLIGLMIAIILQSIGYSMGIVGRIVPYYTVYCMVVIPNSIFRWKGKLNKILYVFATIFFGLMFLYDISGNIQRCGYQFVWQ